MIGDGVGRYRPAPDADGRPTRCPPTDRTSFAQIAARRRTRTAHEPLYCTEIGTIVPIAQHGFALKRWLDMLVVIALILGLFGGPTVSLDDGTSGGPSLYGAASVSAPTSGPSDDGTSGGPSRP
jgi:hypothetical protein